MKVAVGEGGARKADPWQRNEAQKHGPSQRSFHGHLGCSYTEQCQKDSPEGNEGVWGLPCPVWQASSSLMAYQP